MATYTVHVPPGIGDAVRRAERTVFVREGFSWPAFVFGPVYLLYRRLWLGTVGWLLAAVVLVFLSHAAGLSPPETAALFGLLALLTGFEAGTLRQHALGRRGHGFAAVLTSPSREQAERVFFEGEGPWTPPPRVAAAAGPGVPATSEALSDIIGLFPRAGEA